MAKNNILNDMKSILSEDKDFLKPLVSKVLHEILEEEMNKTIGAGSYERSAVRSGYRAGYYNRQFITRVGPIDLRIPRDRDGKFSTSLFERYERSEKALLAALVEMYVQGVSTRKIKSITEELCGQEFSASSISVMNKSLDKQLKAFSDRRLEISYPYIVLDARYEKVRENGIVHSQAVLIALGVNETGKREVLGIELSNKESLTSWKDFLISLRNRGLHGVKFVISDQHQGLKTAIQEVFPEAAWQRCYVHFLRNALNYFPRKSDSDCMQELRWIYERKNVQEAQGDLNIWIRKWESKYPKLVSWVEDNIGETLSFYHLPQAHHKHTKSTNLIERLNQEIKRRSQVVRIFPNGESCLRLVTALSVEIHENWQDTRYLNMKLLKEHKKNQQIGKQNVA